MIPEPECYICNDDATESPLLSDVCDCKTRHVHLDCQVRLIKERETDAVCSVCRAPYRNVVVYQLPNAKRRRLLHLRAILRLSTIGALFVMVYGPFTLLESGTPRCDERTLRHAAAYAEWRPMRAAVTNRSVDAANRTSTAWKAGHLCAGLPTLAETVFSSLILFCCVSVLLMGSACATTRLQRHIEAEPATETVVTVHRREPARRLDAPSGAMTSQSPADILAL